ncbi:MAG TPA: lysylphosphatidylglycerol synthase transmembrane domain-containing protein [Gaiellaceae bacterium]|nr:lysylphosphatidylglycerol synthase transmembrane domain-containing protein [Gaiellaceae bacterium]
MSKRWRGLLVVPVLGGAIALFVFHGPDWHLVHDAFTVVRWEWVVAAIGLNLASVLTRALAWETAIKQSLDPPHPRFPLVFSAFSVGLFANAVLPGRVGEVARVAVLRRRLPHRRGTAATLIGSVFAHRMFDLPPAATLVVFVLVTARLPGWALGSIGAALAIGLMLMLVALVLARRQRRELEELGRVRLLLARAREGLTILRTPRAAATAVAFQYLGWFCQLLAVWAAMRAFHIYQPLSVAGLVLVLINVVTIVPFWPGNVGVVQIAIATSLVGYSVAYARGFAFGIGLQAIEASVGVGVGTIFLAREGLSYAMLKQLDHGDDADDAAEPELDGVERANAGARVPG